MVVWEVSFNCTQHAHMLTPAACAPELAVGRGQSGATCNRNRVVCGCAGF